MKPNIYGLSGSLFLMAVGLLVNPAMANPQPLPGRLIPSEGQIFSGSLYRFGSQDFFEQGQRRLEVEIKLLTRREQFLTGDVLKISPELLAKPDFSSLERPQLDIPSVNGAPRSPQR